jgi:hypothetical protein
MKPCTLMPSLGTSGLRSGNNACMSGRSTWSSASLRLATGKLAGPYLDLSPLPVEPASRIGTPATLSHGMRGVRVYDLLSGVGRSRAFLRG